MRFTNILLSTTLLTTVFGAHKVMAQVNCATIPDCASLGYSSTESSCNGSWLYCPFNSAYKKCVPSSASCEGFTKDDKTSWCKTIVPCAGDDTLTLCAELLTKDCSSYTLDKCGDYDVCESCSDGSGTTKYKITGCKNNKMIITTIKGVEGCYEYYDSCEDAGFYTMLDSKPCGDPSAFALSANGGFHACYAEECLTCKTTCYNTNGCVDYCTDYCSGRFQDEAECYTQCFEGCNKGTDSWGEYTEVCTNAKGETTTNSYTGAACTGTGVTETGKNSHGVGGGGGRCGTSAEDCYSGGNDIGQIGGKCTQQCTQDGLVYNMQDESVMVASLSKEEALKKYAQTNISDDDFPVYNS